MGGGKQKQEEVSSFPLGDLHESVLPSIFSHLSPRDLASVSRVSRAFHSACQLDEVWRRQLPPALKLPSPAAFPSLPHLQAPSTLRGTSTVLYCTYCGQYCAEYTHTMYVSCFPAMLLNMGPTVTWLQYSFSTVLYTNLYSAALYCT